MVIPNSYKMFLQQSVEENIQYIKYLGQDIGYMKRLREMLRDNAETELLISEIIWEEWNLIPEIKKEIALDKKRIAQLA